MKKKRESASQYLKRIADVENEKDAREIVERALTAGLKAISAVQGLGVVTLLIMPDGLHAYQISPNLVQSLEGLEIIEKALSKFRDVSLTNRRKVLIEAEARQRVEALEKKNLEENK